MLLQGERDVDQGDEAGRTPLALAALRGHTDCVHTLLSQGASPRSRDSARGRTPVHLAGKEHAPPPAVSETASLLLGPFFSMRWAVCEYPPYYSLTVTVEVLLDVLYSAYFLVCDGEW